VILVVHASAAVEYLLQTAVGQRGGALLEDADVERITQRLLLRHAWSLRGHVTPYDALYVAAANIRGAALVTADGPLARAAGLGVVVHDVRIGA
jgi:predicted nucleic acid-binding protein